MRDDGAQVLSLLEADPDLGNALSDEERKKAERGALARIARLSPGTWDAAASHAPEIHHRGFMIVEGLLCREVEIMHRRCVELLGHGDVMRPWSWDPDGSHVHAEIGWRVLERTRLAVLDAALVARVAPWPQIGLELYSRGIRRAHALAVALAIAHQPRVDDRLSLTLWHLAERWGRVSRDGVVLALPLPHQRLADLVGAHRPSVTTAVGDLSRAGVLSRRESGEWVLHGSPPAQFRHHRLAASLT